MPPCFDGSIIYSKEPLPQATHINIRLFTDFSQTTSKFLLSLIVPHTYITTKYSKSLLMHYQHHTPQATKKRRNPKPNIISPSFSNCSNSNFHSSINLIKLNTSSNHLASPRYASHISLMSGCCHHKKEP